jgi:protein-S-isoprenylcysteine O-methyltransferase Ste14
VNLVIFLVGTIGFIILSRQAFFHRHSHGFPRFFAFESILGLVVLNTPYWFIQPFSIPQVISWVLLLGAGILVVSALYSLQHGGAPDRSIKDKNRIAFEKTTHLVTTGPYRHIRHPMYASLLYLAWGITFKHINIVSILLLVITSLALFLTALYEEQENLQNFGDEYTAYMKLTRRFVPFVF